MSVCYYIPNSVATDATTSNSIAKLQLYSANSNGTICGFHVCDEEFREQTLDIGLNVPGKNLISRGKGTPAYTLIHTR